MKRNFTFLIIAMIAIAVTPQSIYAQSPASVANFGIDGDLYANTRLAGSFPGNGTHDWFRPSGGGSGIGLVDTTGTSVFTSRILSGQNIYFTRGQSVPRYSIVDGMYMLDTRYGRDGFGCTPGLPDSTVFKGSNKNGASPYIWGFENPGGGVQNKNDIIDIYAHMRRNGTTINATNPSPLYLIAGASTLGVDGDRYIDFELYRSRITFSHSTGFTNSGPKTTGGHSAWTFNADGTVAKTGDMMLSFSYNSSSVSDVAVYIWVSSSVKNTVNPFYFDFIPAEFYGDGNAPAWGYCRITQNNGAPNFQFNATANTASTNGPFWGTNSKDFGTSPNNYAASQYATGQYSEVAINLTSLGIDPALGNSGSTTDPCAPPFTRIVVKTRASNSFTSELKDFTGPYPFLDAPQVPSQIAPASLTCSNNEVTLSPMYPQNGAFYTWATVNGQLLTSPISQNVTVRGPGTYYLTSSIANGCLGLVDSIVVERDMYQPVASAVAIGIVSPNNPLLMANLVGGDPVASNYVTEFGSSQGLSWEWQGPSGFTANTKDASTNIPGNYQLIVTELRNGCKDTALTAVVQNATLPVKIQDFSATRKDDTRKANVRWVVTNNAPFTTELTRSFNGTDFKTISVALQDGNKREEIQYTDNLESYTHDKVYYRLKLIEESGLVVYSSIVTVSFKNVEIKQLQLAPNPVNNYTVVTFKSDVSGSAVVQILDASGKMKLQKTVQTEKGVNNISINNLEHLSKGFYLVRIISNNRIETGKLIKQ
ncbi:MAG TPA: T9SS type A sorting domain-containing protein [Lacibacter sp.]|nr:T9SS type A sorting domain-containing protein [Lacibacter sp.]